MRSGFAYRNSTVMTGHADSGGLIVGKRNYDRRPLTGVVTGFAGIGGVGVRGAFIAGAVTTAGDTSTDDGFIVAERDDGRYPSAAVMTGIAVVAGLWMRRRFAADAGA